ncbi:MAG: hypothetical protein ACK46X_02805 [Candidatus Sericytochromatia bacterium]
MKATWMGTAAAVAMMAAPAMAQENLIGLDYFETTSTRLLAPNQAQAQHALSMLDTPFGAPANQVTLNYGLAETLMVGGGLQTGGENAFNLAVPSYHVGMIYAPDYARNGWTPALQLQYQGGFNQTLMARGVFSFDAPVVAIGNGVTDRFNLSTNVLAETPFRDGDGGELVFKYNVGLSYPVWGAAAPDAPEGLGPRALQRRPESMLRAALELKGDLGGAGSHYAIPGVFLSPSETTKLGLGVGLRLAGNDKPLYWQTQVQLSF